MIQAFYMDRCHFCPSPESSKVICRSIQRKVKDFFSFFTCSMSVKKELWLVLLCHEPLYFRHRHTIRFPRGESVRQRFSIKLTMAVRLIKVALARDTLQLP